MRIPLLSKKNKKILEKNEQRLVDLTQEQQLVVFNDKKIKVEEKVYQILKENNELRLLLDEKEHEISKKLRKGKPHVFEMGYGTIDMHPIKINTDHTIEWGKGKQKRTAEIMNKPLVLKLNGFWHTKQFPVYFVESDGEVTYPPFDETPIEIKKRGEGMLKIGNQMKKMAFIEHLLMGLKTVKKWIEYIPWGVVLLIVIAFLVFIGMFFGEYNLTKA